MAEENIVIKIKADVGISKEVIESVTKAMEGLGKTATIVSGNVKVTNKNLEDTNKILGQVGETAKKTGNAIGRTGDSVKKSNMQWTNLALVVQDLPYGFRGIQNNLPALIGGMAGMTGALYLVGSAVIALFTAWDNGMIKFGNTLTSVELKQKAFNDVLDKSKDSYTEAKTQVMLLNDQVAEAAGKKDLERKAVKDYNDTIGESLGKLKTFKEVQSSLIDQGDKYIDYIFKLNMANTAASKVAEESANMLIASFKKPLDFVNNIDKLFAVQFNMFGDLAAAATGTAKKLYESGKENQQEAIQGFGKSAVAAEEVMKIFRQQAKEAKKLLSFGTFDDGKKGGKQKDNYLLDSLKAQQQAYKDDIYAFRAYGILIINEEERLAVERAKTDGTYLQNKKDIHARYEADRLTNNNLFEANLNKVLDDNAKIRTAQEKKELEIQAANRLNIGHAILAINKQFAEDDLRNAILFAKKQTSNIETELGVQDKLNKNSLSLRIEDTKQALAKLAVLAAFTFDPKVLGVYLDAIDKMTAKLKGLGTTWEETTKAMDSIIKSFINDSLFALGDSIGKALMGENVDALDAFGNLLADAIQALGKQLIAYGTVKLAALKALETTTPMGALLAIAAGIAAVAAGAALKSSLNQSGKGGINSGSSSNAPRKFANGGIISGPTMGLMGEYPGARANPEVVAPLDKLKDMIGGGGGGTFMLRGQDLLLSVNRAQKASNLKGQNISLV